jgi:YihY family inner membrane protein
MQSFLRRFWAFFRRVFRDFRANKGLLLASAVGYNMLLSLVPLCILALVALSLFFEQQQIIQIVNAELQFLIPGQADWLTTAVVSVVENRSYLGGATIFALLFFSGLAFRTLEDAMEVIFHRPGPRPTRHPLISAILPYVFILVIGFGITVLTVVTATLDALAGARLELFGFDVIIAPLSGVLLYVAGLVGLAALFSGLYKVMPVTRIRTSHAVIGGTVAALLWEIARRIIGWYFASISVVNVVYGSLATVIVVLFTMEIAAVIILAGAQIIAELEANNDQGRPWYGQFGTDTDNVDLKERSRRTQGDDP